MAMDRKDKKDLNARMTDVEEVSCKNCYGLKINQTGDCRQTPEHTSDVFICNSYFVLELIETLI